MLSKLKQGTVSHALHNAGSLDTYAVVCVADTPTDHKSAASCIQLLISQAWDAQLLVDGVCETKAFQYCSRARVPAVCCTS